MKMNVAYLRVSTEAQTEKYGLDVQKQKILDYCNNKGISINRWYVDGGYSGSKLNRPEIQKLLDDAENGLIGTVYIYKLDRMSRDVIDTLNLLYRILPKYDIKVVSMTEDIKTENPMDKVMVTINAAMNQYEREVIRMRMSAGMIERIKRGYWMGGGRIPWGYYYDRNDGILHPHPEQAEMVRQAYQLYIDGYSCDKISKMLGFKGERIVIQILKRKSNIGIIKYKGEEYRGLHEPIVDEKIFYKAQECMKKRHTNSHINNDNLLSGLCWCGVCGARMRYQKWGKYHKLICYSQQKSKKYLIKDPNCDNDKVVAKDIENEVENRFKRFAISIKDVQEKERNNVEVIEEAIRKSNAKIKKFYSMYAEHESDNLLELAKEEEAVVKKLKTKLKEELSEKKTDTEQIEEVRNIVDVWDDMSNRDKNRILKKCVEKIVITKDSIEISFVTF